MALTIKPTEFHCEFHNRRKGKVFAERILNFIPREEDKLSMEGELYRVVSVTYSLDEIVQGAIAVFIIVDQLGD